MNLNALGNDIPLSQQILDADSVALKKIEAANMAVIEAIIAMANGIEDPVTMTLLNVSSDDIRILANNRHKLIALAMTATPIFKLRLTDEGIPSLLADGASEDTIFKSLLRSFNNPLPMRKL